MSKDIILVTDWEIVDEDDFYLEKEWLKENQSKEDDEIKEILDLAKNKGLYIGYIVGAKEYAIYNQMDAQQVLINSDLDVLVDCENAIINNNHDKRIEYEY